MRRCANGWPTAEGLATGPGPGTPPARLTRRPPEIPPWPCPTPSRSTSSASARSDRRWPTREHQPDQDRAAAAAAPGAAGPARPAGAPCRRTNARSIAWRAMSRWYAGRQPPARAWPDGRASRRAGACAQRPGRFGGAGDAAAAQGRRGRRRRTRPRTAGRSAAAACLTGQTVPASARPLPVNTILPRPCPKPVRTGSLPLRKPG